MKPATLTFALPIDRIAGARAASAKPERPLLRFLRDKRGATAIEYTLIVALVAVALIVGLRAAGTDLVSIWENTINPTMKTALSSN